MPIWISWSTLHCDLCSVWRVVVESTFELSHLSCDWVVQHDRLGQILFDILMKWILGASVYYWIASLLTESYRGAWVYTTGPPHYSQNHKEKHGCILLARILTHRVIMLFGRAFEMSGLSPIYACLAWGAHLVQRNTVTSIWYRLRVL